MTWRLATELAPSEGRRHGGATTLITRSPARIGFGGGTDMTINVQPPVVALANARVYFWSEIAQVDLAVDESGRIGRI